ncbi:unnamed protein product [Peniophora sp. CBMAI 1063]|nr:unnamed protein product [Peniophora sp. CBMAI 1063]
MDDTRIDSEVMNGDSPVAHALSNVDVAPDDEVTWATITDIALNHISRVTMPAMHPQDLDGLAWPRNLPRVDSPAKGPSPVHRIVLVNKDAHIPTHARHPATAHYIVQAVAVLYPALVQRPSQSYTPYLRKWRCPQAGCSYSEDLAYLSPAAGEFVCRIAASALDSTFIANELASDFAMLVDGHYRARREFAKHVVDIVGLRHYESHLQDIGLRCLIRGQTPEGYVRRPSFLRR